MKRVLVGFVDAVTLIFFVVIGVSLLFVVGYFSYYYGYAQGHNDVVSSLNAEIGLLELTSQIADEAQPERVVIYKNPQRIVYPTWGGPELWEAVNKRRQELGVNALGQRDELCTIASIRLNELLELGKLDGHTGFSNLPERREDLKWIFEKYNISEFLLSGAQSASEAVELWENTLGHKKIVTGGEYVWGCIYAQNGFAVAMAAY